MHFFKLWFCGGAISFCWRVMFTRSVMVSDKWKFVAIMKNPVGDLIFPTMRQGTDGTFVKEYQNVYSLGRVKITWLPMLILNNR